MPKPATDKNVFRTAARTHFGRDLDTITREQVLEVVNSQNTPYPNWLTVDPAYRAGRGLYLLNTTKEFALLDESAESSPLTITTLTPGASGVHDSQLVPPAVSGYVPFGHFGDVEKIIASRKFYPAYITGLSGNGKTMMVEQVCAKLKRDLIRVNVTRETDEDDLLGGFRLVNGETVWHHGPVVQAMQRGAILLLDEIDLGDAKLMCLQPVLEGKQILLKKINQIIKPSAGFNIIATANTKGRGSDDGRFIGTNVMNEAFLERFSITLEQEYAAVDIETQIVNNVLVANGLGDEKLAHTLSQWAEATRTVYTEGGASDLITTRRLVHIVDAYAIFGDIKHAIKLCIARFDDATKSSFLESFNKLYDDEDDHPDDDKISSVADEITF